MTMSKTQTREAEIFRRINGENDGFLSRDMSVVSIDAEARTIELSFSSEAEVERWGWIEVLSHDSGACDLSRLNDKAALLENHNWDKQRGVVEKAWIDSKKGRAIVRFSRSAAAEELFQDVIDGIKTKVSVGYRVKSLKLAEERDGGCDVYVITGWVPHEISIVSVPADTEVGTDRSARPEEKTPMATTGGASDTDSHESTPHHKVDIRMAAPEKEHQEREPSAEHASGAATERNRVRQIHDIAGKVAGNVEGLDELVRNAASNGDSPADFQAVIIEKLNERAAKPLRDEAGRSADLGMEDKEVRRYSLVKAIRALADPTNKTAQREAAFEFEASEAAEKNQERQSENFIIPVDVLRQSVYARGDQTRAFNSTKTGTAAGDTGGYSIATDLMSASFIEILRARATIMRRGRILGGLVGNVDIPKQIASGTGYWIGTEGADATETGPELGQISLNPKTVAGYTDITRKLLKQSSLDVEALVRADLAAVLGLTIDKAGYYGSATAGQPRGITNYTGINAVTFTAAGKPTFAELVKMETEVAVDNADVESMHYVGPATFRGYAKSTPKFSSAGSATIWESGNSVNGYNCDVTNQIATNDVVLGNFSDLIIAMWGGLELMVDPFSKSKSGTLRVIAFQDVDFALRRVESFCLGR